MYLNIHELSGKYYIRYTNKERDKLKIYNYSKFNFRWFILYYRNFRVIKLKNFNHELYKIFMYLIILQRLY